MRKAKVEGRGVGRPLTNPLLRLIPKIQIGKGDDPCWMWIGTKSASGYAQLRMPHTTVRAHRWLYEHIYGPQKKQLDHLCRNRACINPDHLEPVTCRENLLRSPLTQASKNSKRIRCQRGHKDWGQRADGSGRYCKPCHLTATQAWRIRNEEDEEEGKG